MKIENIKKVQQLRANAKELSGFWEAFKDQAAKSNIDKYGAGFGLGRDHYHFKVNTSFYAYSGSYGSSSVYGFGRFDQQTVEPYILKAMNALSDQIFSKAAELMNKDAADMVSMAQKELDELQSALTDALEASA